MKVFFFVFFISVIESVLGFPSLYAQKDEVQFRRVIKKVIDAHQSLAMANGVSLTDQSDWGSNILNATFRVKENEWQLLGFGGLYRLDGLTDDAYALVLCHELGHITGGFPYKTQFSSSTSEKQSDYFATLYCLRKVFENDLEQNAMIYKTANSHVKMACLDAHENRLNAYVCVRSAEAAMNLTQVFSERFQLGHVDITTPSEYITEADLFEDSPVSDLQCRLDTFFQGALCPIQHELWSYYPAESVNPNSIEVEKRFLSLTCSESSPVGARPKCWFRQR